MSNKEETYSTRLFDKQFVRIKAKLDVLLKDKSIKFKGIWVFTYIKGANSLQSIYFNHVEIDNLKQDHDEILKEIEKTCLDCDYGSLGYAFQELNAKDNEIVKFLKNTYDDPKGTVCYYDIIISQRHACFVKIKEGNNTLGVLDLFFDGEMKETDENEIVKFFKEGFNCSKGCQYLTDIINAFTIENEIVKFFKEGFNCSKGCQYLTDIINAFTIKEYERFLELQDEKNVSELETGKNIKELGNAVKYIERIIASSSMTPLMVIKHKRGEYIPELVALNYDFIHSIIKHEQRFCSLTADKDCFYFKECKSFINNALCCENDFMKLFYYDVLKKLNAVVIAKKINVVNVGYDVEIVCSCENIEIDESIFEALSNEVSKNDKLKNVIAINKYRDERVYLKLEEILREKDCVYAFSLSRIINPHLRFILQLKCENLDCCQRNDNVTYEIKRFISPSTILPVQCLEKENEYLKSIKSERKNIVHFQITNEKDFKKTLKQLIAINKNIYLKALSPYLKRYDKVSFFGYKNLIIDGIGEDPLKDNKFSEIIKGKYSLIEAILQENEVKLQATRAAISQVMARNMSHNIGSHVMNKLVTGVKNIDWKKTKYTSLINNDLTVKLQKDKDKHEIIIDQLTCFNNYIRSRMDYLADIALGTPVMQYGRSVKDVMLEFDKVRLLLEYISGLSDFKYEIEYNDTINYVVAMPNNVLGCQALYNIIENIIRNTAKHGGATETVRFEINIREISDHDLKQKYGDDLYEVTVCDSVPAKDEELADKQNEKINGKIIGDDYKLRHGSLGMAEMKSSAAYLRKISLSLIDSEDIDPPLLAAFLDDNKHLVYRFYLRKPKMVMYVKNNISGQTLNDKLKTNGVELLSSVDFKNKLCNGAIFDHNFIVYDDDEIVELIKMDQYRSSLPVRCYKKEAIDINEINALADDYEVLHKDIWDKWLEINVIDKNYKVSNVLPTDITKNADGSLTQSNKLCIENHKEHLVIDNLTTLIKSGIQIDDLHNHKIFSETINSLGIRQLPYYEHIPELKPKSEISEATDYVIKINEDDVERYRVFFNQNHNYYVSNIDNLNTLRAKYADLCLWQLSEAAVTRILVIDERIQEYAKSEKNYRTLMWLVNINIPDKKINLSDNDIKSRCRYIMDWINAELDKRTQFMVLHYGILERLVGDDKSEIDTILNAWAAKCTVVVTSGRGSYFVLPSSVRFMNLSNIHNAFIDIKNKYYITAVLHASRKKGEY